MMSPDVNPRGRETVAISGEARLAASPVSTRTSTQAQWPQLSAIVDGALDLTPAGRGAFIVDACRGDEGLLIGVDRLLAGCDHAGALLAEQACEFAAPVLRELALEGHADSSGLASALAAAVGERYRIDRQLGQGGMAVVYLAHDNKHGCTVAIKVMRPECAAPLASERFLREIRITAGLVHPNVLPLLDSGAAGGLLYYVTPFVDGESLRSHLSRRGQLEVGEAVRLTREIAGALEYAHRRGIVHRDIKPENILLAEGHAVVADFGIARATAAAADGRVSLPGLFLGSPAYMSPEQARAGGKIDGRSDIYSLGCVLYEMLAGQPPFMGPSADSVMRQHSLVAAPPVAAIRESVSAMLASAVARALAKTPADRFASMAEFSDALQSSQEPGSTVRIAEHATTKFADARWAVTAGIAPLVMMAALLWPAREHPVAASPPVSMAVANSATHVAVFPFDVHAGPDMHYVGEGVMDLLGGAIDGVGDFRRVDPRELMARLREGPGRHDFAVSPDGAQRISTELGAGRYVTGGAWIARGRLRLDASLHDVSRSGIPIATAQVEGAVEDLPALVTTVARSLFLNEPGRAGTVITDIAALRAANDAAERAYLKGEAMLRRGEYDSAAVLLRRAVEADSHFGLAWYRLGHAAGERAGRQMRH